MRSLGTMPSTNPLKTAACAIFGWQLTLPTAEEGPKTVDACQWGDLASAVTALVKQRALSRLALCCQGCI